MSKEKLIQRYKRSERINHWIVAVCFVLLAISGLAFFYPAFFWLTGVFGTPQLARILHPFIGVVMFVGFFVQFFRYWKYNFLDKEDIKWMTSVKSVLKGHGVGDIGKYNGGQKGMFWLMTGCMMVLMITGFIAWRPYFAEMFPIPVIRLALLFHAWAALILIAGIVVPCVGGFDFDCGHYCACVCRFLGERYDSRHGGRGGNASVGEKTPPTLVS